MYPLNKFILFFSQVSEELEIFFVFRDFLFLLFPNIFFIRMVKWRDIESKLSEEIKVLDSLIYRSKNQHKSSLILRKMLHLRRLFRMSNLVELTSFKKSKIIDCAQMLYIYSSADLSMGFFIPLNLCILGTSARIHYLIKICEINKKENYSNAIDDIFQGI